MRIVCPICTATYEVSDTLLAPGRTVRCARCGEEWVAIPTEPPAAPEPEPEPPAPSGPEPQFVAPPTLTAMDRLASRPATVSRPPAALRAAWLASLLALVLFCWGMIAWRDTLMRVWPPSTRLYDVLGLTPAQTQPPAR